MLRNRLRLTGKSDSFLIKGLGDQGSSGFHEKQFPKARTVRPGRYIYEATPLLHDDVGRLLIRSSVNGTGVGATAILRSDDLIEEMSTVGQERREIMKLAEDVRGRSW